MKYAFMSFSCPQASLDEMLSLAERFGYEGVELRIASGHKHGAELDAPAAVRKEIRNRIEASGVALCCVSTSCKYADPANARQQAEETLRCIELARDVGSPLLRVFGGKIPEGTSREEAVRTVAESLRSVADAAQDSGVKVCLETHDDWSNPEYVAEVMRRVEHPAVGALWDVMHPVRSGGSTMDDAFRTLEPWIRHVHFHDRSNRSDKMELVPVGEGEFDHERVVQLLQAADYDGFLSGEWINWEPAEVHLPREIATMKRYEQERV